jgi:cytochrome b561
MKQTLNSSSIQGNVREFPTQHTGVIRATNAATGKHAPATIALHWGTVIAVVAVVAAIYLRELTEEKWIRQAFLDAHRQLGLLIIMALGLRIAVRFSVGMANHSKDMPALMRWAAWMAHVALYVMLLAVPLLGWAASNAHDVKLNLLGAFPLPSLVKADSDLSDTLDDYHKWSTWGMGALVLMHIGAALWHHYVRKDAVLTAMLPNKK